VIDRTVAVLGYGHQGRAQALNLRDSGARVVVGAREGGAGAARASADGFAPQPLPAAARAAGDGFVAALLPDHVLAPAFAPEGELFRALAPGAAVVLAHGFAARFGGLVVPAACDLVVVSPAAPGQVLRDAYVAGRGVPMYVAAVAAGASGGDPARALERARAYARALGADRPDGSILDTDLATETDIDLFGEQAVVVGGVTELVEAAFATLVAAGYDERIAYLEVVHQLKHLVDVIHDAGPDGLRDRVSGTALYGALTRGPRVIGPEARASMAELLEEVRSGAFAAEWQAEVAAGSPRLAALRDAARARGLAGVRARALPGGAPGVEDRRANPLRKN
jgi:ketol-acid reductoisomerase